MEEEAEEESEKEEEVKKIFTYPPDGHMTQRESRKRGKRTKNRNI